MNTIRNTIVFFLLWFFFFLAVAFVGSLATGDTFQMALRNDTVHLCSFFIGWLPATICVVALSKNDDERAKAKRMSDSEAQNDVRQFEDKYGKYDKK